MKQSAKRFSSLILAALFLVVAFVVFFDLLQPAYGDLETEKSKQISNDTFIANEQQIVSQVQALISAYQKQSQGQQNIDLALPVGQNLAGAVAQIYGLASVNNIAVKNIGVGVQAPQPQAQSSQAAAPSGASGQIAQVAAGGSIVKGVGIITFQITAEGSYEGFKQFVRGLENNIRIFDMKSISIQQTPLTFGKISNPDNFTYSLGVSTYFQNPQ